MKLTATPTLFSVCLIALLSMPISAVAQSDASSATETTLAVIEGSLSREALNEVRLSLNEQGVRLNYRNFQFHPQTKELIGTEIHMIVDGVEFKKYVEFVSPTCILRITKESGFSLEGC